MTPLATALWLFNLVLDTGGQLAFKAAASDPHAGDGLARWRHMLTRPWLIIGVVCYVLEFPVWIAFLSQGPLTRGVLLGSIDMVVIMLAGRWLFKEKLTRMRVIGILLVSMGVAVVGAAG